MANRKGNKGYKVETYIAKERRERPSINKEDYDLWNQIQFEVLFDEKQDYELNKMVEVYRAWDEDRGEDFHKLVHELKVLMRV